MEKKHYRIVLVIAGTHLRENVVAALSKLGADVRLKPAEEVAAAEHALASSSTPVLVISSSHEKLQSPSQRRSAMTSTLLLEDDDVIALAAMNAGVDYILPTHASGPLVSAVFVAACRIADLESVMNQMRQRAASVAHEINNPLQSIVAGLEDIEGLIAATNDPERRQVLADMRVGAERIRAITRSLLPSTRSFAASSSSRRPPSSSIPPDSTTHTTQSTSEEPSAAPPRSSHTAPRGSATRGAPRILVIDDEEALLRTYRRSLRELDVVTAHGGQEAIDVLTRDVAFDAILCDLMMPSIDGPMVYAFVEKNIPTLTDRILFCSGGAFTAPVRAFLDRITNLVLDKPVGSVELRAAIAKIVAASKAASSGSGSDSESGSGSLSG